MELETDSYALHSFISRRHRVSQKKKDSILSFWSMNLQRVRNEIPITQCEATPTPCSDNHFSPRPHPSGIARPLEAT